MTHYKMCTSQPAQLDCHRNGCTFHKAAHCINVSPALTLNADGSFVCWSSDNSESHSYYVPLKVELMNVCGLYESLKAMRLPHNAQSDSGVAVGVGSGDAKRSGALIHSGDDHAKAMRGIKAYIQLEMQVGWMIEFETYVVGVDVLSTTSSMHSELRHLRGVELAERKQAGLPAKIYTRIVDMNYQALRRIYFARRKHRHPDWQIFCDFIEELPHFDTLICPIEEVQL